MSGPASAPRHAAWMWAGAWTFALAVCGAGAASCQQALAIDGEVTVRAPSDSVACGLPLKPGACQACLEQSCCAQAQVCAKDPACAAYESCIAACGGDYACRARCLADHPIGNVGDVPALDTCAVASCESACGIGCGLVGSLAEPDAADGCQQCLAAHTCGVAEACGQSVECQSIARCAQSCTTIDCQGACLGRSDAGAQLFESVVIGAASTCFGACSVGSYWECVGRVSHPIAKARSISLTLSILESQRRTGIAGLGVKACDTGDTACASPIATGTTDTRGAVTLVLAVGPSNQYGFHGFFDIASTSSSSPAIVPYLYFLSFPLSEPEAAIQLVVLTPTAFTNLVSLVSVPIDPARGTVAAIANDCFLNGAPDVVFTADGTDGATKERYLEGTYLSNTATSTDRSGLVMFLDAPPGAVRITATPRAIGRASSGASVFVRAGTISLVQANPSP